MGGGNTEETDPTFWFLTISKIVGPASRCPQSYRRAGPQIAHPAGRASTPQERAKQNGSHTIPREEENRDGYRLRTRNGTGEAKPEAAKGTRLFGAGIALHEKAHTRRISQTIQFQLKFI